MEDFEFDSFVVGNSEVEFESSLDELDMVDEFGSEDDVRRARFEARRSNYTFHITTAANLDPIKMLLRYY